MKNSSKFFPAIVFIILFVGLIFVQDLGITQTKAQKIDKLMTEIVIFSNNLTNLFYPDYLYNITK